MWIRACAAFRDTGLRAMLTPIMRPVHTLIEVNTMDIERSGTPSCQPALPVAHASRVGMHEGVIVLFLQIDTVISSRAPCWRGLQPIRLTLLQPSEHLSYSFVPNDT